MNSMTIFLILFFYTKYATELQIYNHNMSQYENMTFYNLINECKPQHSTIDEFPEDYFTQDQRLSGAIIIHIGFLLYIFYILAIVCEDYFIPSIDIICKRLQLEEDVAGATFMAVGSSAPTLFISIIGAFAAEGSSGVDIGLGTILGSTIFNTLFILGICGFFIGNKSIIISKYPLFRDSIVYLIGAIALVSSVYDKTVEWNEALTFIIIYILYVVIMYYNKSVEQMFNNVFLNDTNQLLLPQPQTQYHISSSKHISSENLFDCNHSHISNKNKVLFILSWPIHFMFYITNCLCLTKTNKNLPSNSDDIYPNKWSHKDDLINLSTFLISCLWMGSLAYILVWLVCIVGFTYGVPDCVMGMTLLAAGSSLPDALASIAVIKRGQGDMAIGNAIGSNVFDMLCLGLPWLIKTLLVEPGSSIKIQSHAISISSGLLIFSVFILILAMYLNGWLLNRRLGYIFISFYISIISMATVFELLACPCHLNI